MMLQIFGYAIAVAAALTLVGLAEARLSFMRIMPRRLFWVLALVLSIAWPLAMLLWNPAAPAVVLQEPVSLVESAPTVTAPSTEMVTEIPPAADLQPEAIGAPQTAPDSKPFIADRTLLALWAGLSGALLLYLFVAGLLLARRARNWSRVEIQGREVLVSESTGPALLGVLRPKIVVPRWFLDEPMAKQALILEHEEQHVAARDPLVFRAALLVAVTLPWNLPLWWQLRRLRQAIELDCDARVLRTGAAADSYGEVLLDVTRRAGNVPVGAVAMGEPVSALERRVRSLVPEPARHSLWRAVAVLLLWGTGIGVAASLEAPQLPASTAVAAAAAQPVAQPAAQPSVQPAAQPDAQPVPSAEQQQELLLRAQRLKEMAARDQEQLAQRDRQLMETEKALQQQKMELEKLTVEKQKREMEEAARRAAARADEAAADQGMDLRELITEVARKFKKQFVVDPRVRGTVNTDTLDSNPLTYHAFLEVLGVHGFVAVPSGDVVTIIPNSSVRSAAVPIVSADNIKGDDAEVVTVLLDVEGNMDALFGTIQRLVPSWGVVSPTSQNQLVIVDRVANIKRIAALVKAQAKQP